MQVNEGLFMRNGRCGYILRPECQFDPNYDPSKANTLKKVQPLNLAIKVRIVMSWVFHGCGEVEVF